MNNQQHLLQALNPGREAILASYACQSVVDHMYVDDHACVSVRPLIITPSPPGAVQPHLGTGLARVQPHLGPQPRECIPTLAPPPPSPGYRTGYMER